MNFDPNLKARLVYDGGDKVYIPGEMGAPREDQMQGTVHEQLSELCGRVCYDSLSVGRNSADYHKHLIEVNHGSVYEHAHFTVQLLCDTPQRNLHAVLALANRPGLVLNQDASPIGLMRVTLNYRHLLDWDYWSKRNSFLQMHKPTSEANDQIFDAFLHAARWYGPQIVKHLKWRMPEINERGFPNHYGTHHPPTPVELVYENEKWITLFLSGSRGWSHEQVRHRFCISQRSTRYVDESESPWVRHPLMDKFHRDPEADAEEQGTLDALRSGTRVQARKCYDKHVEVLQKYLVSKGVDKFTARKQARGAARGYLGNALLTEMMFSASVADWKGILRQRLNGAADAEIRVLYSAALPELKRSRYGECFAEFETVDAEDGIGTVLKG